MRKKLTTLQRKAVYDKCSGHCAYCGCELVYKDMQVDHLEPFIHSGADIIENMLPSCRSCNHRKSTSTIESFRKQIERFPTVLMRDSVTYKNAVRFGLVIPNPQPVRFYFEKIKERNTV